MPDLKKFCNVCGEEIPGKGDHRCKVCSHALRTCDRETYDLILGLIKRIKAIEKMVFD